MKTLKETRIDQLESFFKEFTKSSKKAGSNYSNKILLFVSNTNLKDYLPLNSELTRISDIILSMSKDFGIIDKFELDTELIKQSKNWAIWEELTIENIKKECLSLLEAQSEEILHNLCFYFKLTTDKDYKDKQQQEAINTNKNIRCAMWAQVIAVLISAIGTFWQVWQGCNKQNNNQQTIIQLSTSTPQVQTQPAVVDIVPEQINNHEHEAD